MDSRSLGLSLETDLSQRDLNGGLNDLYERDIRDSTFMPRDHDDSLLRSIQRRTSPRPNTPPRPKPPILVDMGQALFAGPGVMIYTYGLDTCIGLAIVSGDGKNKIVAHVSALTQGAVMQQVHTLLQQHRSDFLSSTAYLSVPGTSGPGSPTTPAREDMVHNVKAACECLPCATKIRDRTHQPGPGEGEMHASDEGVFMDRKKV